MKEKDPIAAIATAPGEGAIAVIRLSGEGVIQLADQFFSKKLSLVASHTAHYGKILDEKKEAIDHVLLLVMKGPRSYTGEDTLEISCHGSRLIAKKILQRLYQLGVRPAEPGEFSLRAFLNGKIDLAQAEAVQTLISSKNEEALKQASYLLEGRLSQEIQLLQKELLEVAAILEASLDFPEEDLEFASFSTLKKRLALVLEKIEKMMQTFSDGKVLQEGIHLCLVGAPNVGKSSLMNALLGFDRAIVTQIAGTTRDLLEENLLLGGLHFHLTDTAGIRETEEVIEQEGIRRSFQAIEKADLALILLDATRDLSLEEQELIKAIPEEKRLIVWNKIDLAPINSSASSIAISAKTKEGIDLLKKAIEEKIFKKGTLGKEEVMITHLRHYEALSFSKTYVEKAIDALEHQFFPELIAVDIKEALFRLGKILGSDVTEELLTTIFSKFCLGK